MAQITLFCRFLNDHHYLFIISALLQQMNMHSSPNQPKNHQSPNKKKIKPQNIISILSSDQPQQHAEIKSDKRIDEEVLFQLVRPKVSQQKSRKDKQREKALKMIVDQQLAQAQLRKQQQAKFKAIVAANTAKRLQAQRTAKQLKEMFGSHAYLSIPVLKNMKAQMQNFEKVCKFEQVQEYRDLVARRQYQRKQLTKYLLLTLEEVKLKIKENNRSQLEKELLKPQSDTLRYCYTLATNFQKHFFTNLYIKAKVKDWRKYDDQIRIVLAQFRDKNNLSLKRDILNSKANLKQLITATETSLKCEQTKKDEYEKMEQLIRQHTIQPINYNRQEDKQPEVQLKKVSSVNSFANIPQPVEQVPKQTNEQRQARQKRQLAQRLQTSIKKIQQRIMKYQRSMQRRFQTLKQCHLTNNFFSQLCRKMEMM